ncbi:tetratricopeptide repeat protein [Myxococcota bacterium]|nr:tetratricopeptide repeat protein [Myxococcota bacterium]
MRLSALLLASLLSLGAALAIPQGATRPVTEIDWKNRAFQDPEHGAVRFQDGLYTFPVEPEEEIHQTLTLRGVHFGDLEGDAAQEAVVLTQHWGGGTGLFDAVEIFRATPKGVEAFARIPGGDRGDGGIIDVVVEGRVVKVTRMGSMNIDGACCPSLEIDERWVWRDGAMRLVEDELIVRVRSDAPKGQTFKGALKAARAALKAGDSGEGVEQLRAALSLEPKSPVAWSELGFALMKNDDLLAPLVLRYALQLEVKPKRKAAGWYNLGRAYASVKDHAAAARAFEASLALRPENRATMTALEAARAALKAPAPQP